MGIRSNGLKKPINPKLPTLRVHLIEGVEKWEDRKL